MFLKKILATAGLVAMMAATSAQAAENPCAGKNAMKTNPCAMKTNPCAAKKGMPHGKGANPCAGKNPCAMKK